MAVGLGAVVQVVKDEDVQQLIEDSLVTQVRQTKISPLVGNALALIASDGRQEELLNGTLKVGAQLLKDNRELIKAKISEEIPWWLPQSLDHVIYQKVVDAFDQTLQEVDDRPETIRSIKNLMTF